MTLQMKMGKSFHISAQTLILEPDPNIHQEEKGSSLLPLTAIFRAQPTVKTQFPFCEHCSFVRYCVLNESPMDEQPPTKDCLSVSSLRPVPPELSSVRLNLAGSGASSCARSLPSGSGHGARDRGRTVHFGCVPKRVHGHVPFTHPACQVSRPISNPRAKSRELADAQMGHAQWKLELPW